MQNHYIKDLKFLKEEYDEKEVYVQTTYLSRTYLSALYQLMGMYPNGVVNELDLDLYPDIGHEPYLNSNTSSTNNYHRSTHQSRQKDDR